MRHSILLAAFGALALAGCGPQETTATATDAAVSPRAATAEITVETPAANARVTSPLVTSGRAPANWIFEAQFPAKLIGADGAVIAEAPARSQDDWTNGNPTHPFRAELTFSVNADTPATLVLEQDMPQEGQTPHQVSVAVTLAPR